MRCPVYQCPLARFDSQRSNTFKSVSLNKPFHVAYGIGFVEGVYGQDSVYLENAHVEDQVFGMARSTSQIIYPKVRGANGILGLGYPSLSSSSDHDPFIFQLAKRGLIEQPLFSISLGSDHGWAGELVLGGINHDKYEGDICFTATREDHSNKTYWMVGGRAVEIANGHTVIMNRTFESTRNFIVDTGTTLTYMSQQLIDTILRALSADGIHVTLDHSSGTYFIDCQSAANSSHHVRFILDDDIKLSIPIGSLTIPLNGETVSSSSLCMFGLAPWLPTEPSLMMGRNGWIMLGDTVLRDILLVFDMEKHRIGFAKVTYCLYGLQTKILYLRQKEHLHLLHVNCNILNDYQTNNGGRNIKKYFIEYTYKAALCIKITSHFIRRILRKILHCVQIQGSLVDDSTCHSHCMVLYVIPVSQ